MNRRRISCPTVAVLRYIPHAEDHLMSAEALPLVDLHGMPHERGVFHGGQVCGRAKRIARKLAGNAL
jgi:hypothetical protein